MGEQLATTQSLYQNQHYWLRSLLKKLIIVHFIEEKRKQWLKFEQDCRTISKTIGKGSNSLME